MDSNQNTTTYYIEELIEYLRNSFTTNEAVSFEWFLDKVQHTKNDSNIIEAIDGNQMQEAVTELLQTIMQYFIRSIISGEYILFPNYKDKIEQIGIVSNDYYNDFTLAEDFFAENDYFFLQETHDNLFKAIKEIVHYVISFTEIVKLYSVNTKYEILVSNNFFNNLNLNESNSVNFKNLQLVANTYLHEHRIDESIQYYHSIANLSNEIDNVKETDKNKYIHLSVLSIKLNFLKVKWLLRNKKSYSKKQNQSSLEPAIVLNNDILPLMSTEILPGNKPHLKWFEEIKYHYLKGYEDIQNLTSAFSAIKNENLENLSQKQLRIKIKYYKDILKSSDKLKDVVEALKKLLNKNEDLSVNYLYAYNCLLSLEISNNSSESKIFHIYQKIKELQKEYNLINFFADLKYLDFKTQLYLRKFEQNNEVSKEKDELDINDLLLKFQNLKILFKQSCKYNNLLYYLPYDESYLESEEPELDKVYYHGSILLPVSLEDNSYKISQLEFNLEKLKSQKIAYDSFKNGLKDIEEIKDGLQENNKRLIENFAIFSGIISFIVGSISSFQFIETFIQALLFIVMFGLCISVFILLIFVSTRGLHKVLKNWYVFVGYGAILLILSFYLFPQLTKDVENNKLSKKNEKIIQYKLDSIQKINRGIIKSKDSLTNELINKVNKLEYNNRK